MILGLTAGSARDLHALGLGSAARRPHPQPRRCAHRSPLGIAFFLRSVRGENRWPCRRARNLPSPPALPSTAHPSLHPPAAAQPPVGARRGWRSVSRERVAAQVRLRGDQRLASPALIADGRHARIDGFVSLSVVASAIAVALGASADPIIELRSLSSSSRSPLGLLVRGHTRGAGELIRVPQALAKASFRPTIGCSPPRAPSSHTPTHPSLISCCPLSLPLTRSDPVEPAEALRFAGLPALQ